jgi:hypothetical protein
LARDTILGLVAYFGLKMIVMLCGLP